MIWDLIRDFYVQYIFGGIDSNGDYFSHGLGQVANGDTSSVTEWINGDEFFIYIGSQFNAQSGTICNYMSLSDWLSTISTIITMIAFVIGIIAFMVWLFKLVGNLIMLRN